MTKSEKVKNCVTIQLGVHGISLFSIFLELLTNRDKYTTLQNNKYFSALIKRVEKLSERLLDEGDVTKSTSTKRLLKECKKCLKVVTEYPDAEEYTFLNMDEIKDKIEDSIRIIEKEE